MEGEENNESENAGCLTLLKIAGGFLLLWTVVGAILDFIGSLLDESETEPSTYYFDYDEDSSLDYDCEDFSTSNDAQLFFEENGYGDPHDLDHDGDGLACEWND